MARVRFIAALALITIVLCTFRPVWADTTTALGDRGGEGSTPFTSLTETPEGSLFSGTLTTAIRIQVPPGRKNMTPKLALQYSSSGGPSPFGYGWNVVLGSVQRNLKWGVPRCNGPHSDDFVLTLPGSSVELVGDPPSTGTYRPKVEESYLIAYHDSTADTWTVYDKSGIKYVFGDVASARLGGTDSTNCAFTTQWALTHIEDPNGNSVDISYLSIGNSVYPAFVKYGGNTNGLSHMYTVMFHYEIRPDAIENDLSGAQQTLSLRADTITVSTSAQLPATIRTYTLSYDIPPNGQNGYQSILSSVEATGEPSEYFYYETGTEGLAAPTETWTNPTFAQLRATTSSGEVPETVMDFDGDGYLDIINWTSGADHWDLYRGGRTGFSPSSKPWPVNDSALMVNMRDVDTATDPCNKNGWSCTDRDTFDMNGDGMPDFVYTKPIACDVGGGTIGTCWHVYLNNGLGFSGPTLWPVPVQLAPEHSFPTNAAGN